MPQLRQYRVFCESPKSFRHGSRLGPTPSIQKPNSPSQGWPGIPFRYSGFCFLRADRETDIGFAGCPSAEPLGLRDGGLLLGEHTLLDELTGFAQQVGQRVARLDLDWKRNIGGRDEIMVLIVDRNLLSTPSTPRGVDSIQMADATEFAFLSRGPEWLRADPRRAAWRSSNKGWPEPRFPLPPHGGSKRFGTCLTFVARFGCAARDRGEWRGADPYRIESHPLDVRQACAELCGCASVKSRAGSSGLARGIARRRMLSSTWADSRMPTTALVTLAVLRTN